MTLDEAMGYIRRRPNRAVIRTGTGMRVAWRFGREVVLTGGARFIDFTPTDEDMRADDWQPDIRALIEASSLGTPEAVALRAQVSDEDARRVLARVREFRENGDRQ